MHCLCVLLVWMGNNIEKHFPFWNVFGLGELVIGLFLLRGKRCGKLEFHSHTQAIKELISPGAQNPLTAHHIFFFFPRHSSSVIAASTAPLPAPLGRWLFVMVLKSYISFMDVQCTSAMQCVIHYIQLTHDGIWIFKLRHCEGMPSKVGGWGQLDDIYNINT